LTTKITSALKKWASIRTIDDQNYVDGVKMGSNETHDDQNFAGGAKQVTKFFYQKGA
jgi:hypothetical protein